MKDSETRIVDNRAKKTLCYSMAVLLPNIVLFYLYNSNVGQNDIRFVDTVILAALLAIFSIIAFLVCRCFAHSLEGALLGVLLFWLSFWFFEQIYSIVRNYFTTLTRIPMLFLLLFAVAFVIWCYRNHVPPFHRNYPITIRVLIVAIFALFLYNFIPAFYHFTGTAIEQRDRRSFHIRTEFIVDESLPNPDVYWFHLDGMWNFGTIYKYFGETQDELKAELESRGFTLNETAELIAGSTIHALPALMSPAFYDSYWGERLSEVSHLLRRQRNRELSNRLAIDGVSLSQAVFPNYELIHAFMAADYTVVSMSVGKGAQFQTYDYLYHSHRNEYPLAVSDAKTGKEQTTFYDSYWWQMLALTTPLYIINDFISNQANEVHWVQIPEYEDVVNALFDRTHAFPNPNNPFSPHNPLQEKLFYRQLIDSFSISSPKILVYAQFTHEPFGTQWDWEDRHRYTLYDLYMHNHFHSAKMMLNQIDLVLEHNPNAVIVLQADHGVHLVRAQKLLVSRGYSDEEILEMNYSTISAVRIPEQYGGLDEPLNPLNISRELVNRFVGENYELLPIEN